LKCVVRNDHRAFESEQAHNLASNRDPSALFGVIEDNKGKWPQPELPGASNIEEAAVQQMDNGSGSSRLNDDGSVGDTGSCKTVPLALAEPENLPSTRSKALKGRDDVSSGEDSGNSERSVATGGSHSSGHGSCEGGGSRLRSKLLPLPGPGPATVPDVSSSTFAGGKPEMSSGIGEGDSRGADKGPLKGE
jgi:hypothetical protein